MDTKEEKELVRFMKEEVLAKSRGYADSFGWPPNRDLEEYGVVKCLCESMEKDGNSILTDVKSRGRGNDPPDCEARDKDCRRRIGIEVTELVDPGSIVAFKAGLKYQWAEWNKEKLIKALENRLDSKNTPDKVKDGPYNSYIVVIHTDEPLLSFDAANELLYGCCFAKRELIDRAFLLFFYDPEYNYYPYIELDFSCI